MGLRLLLSRLASAPTRDAASRALAGLCALGAALTILVLAATGRGGQPWLFVLLAWALFVYIPLRILLETAQTLAPALRRRLSADARRRPTRYAGRVAIELTVERLFERAVVMPRIARPWEAAKARDGATAVLARAGQSDRELGQAARDCLGAVDGWARAIGAWAVGEAGQNIQARWSGVRALAGLAAMTKILVAAYAERAGALTGGDGPIPAEAFLDACLDYCDDLALQIDVSAWSGPALPLPVGADRVRLLRAAWTAYAEAAAPALAARQAFLDALFTASSPPARPSAS